MDYIIKNNQPKTLSCQVNCSMNFSGCDVIPDWFVRIRTDNYRIHSLSNPRKDVLNELTFESNNEKITCARYDKNHFAHFYITFSSIGIYDEVLVSCGLKRENNNTVYDQFLAVIKKCKVNFNDNLENVKKK